MDKIQYRELGRYKYETTRLYRQQIGITGREILTHRYIQLTPEGWLTIFSGYAWDGPSGPTIDTKNSLRGSLVHDSLYQLMKMGVLSYDQDRESVDKLLRDICIEDGMSKLRAWTWYYAVRLAGKFYSQNNNEPADDVILEAP